MARESGQEWRGGIVGDIRVRVKTRNETERQQKQYRYCSSQEGAENDKERRNRKKRNSNKKNATLKKRPAQWRSCRLPVESRTATTPSTLHPRTCNSVVPIPTPPCPSQAPLRAYTCCWRKPVAVRPTPQHFEDHSRTTHGPRVVTVAGHEGLIS